jgi:hypothetical protein
MPLEKSLISLTPSQLNNLRLLLGFLLIGSCLLVGSSLGFAEDADDESTDYLCAIAVSERGDELMADFQTFLNDYLSQNVPVSEQVEIAMSYFRYIEDAIHGAYEKGMDFSGDKTFELVSSETSLCAHRRNLYIQAAEVHLENSIRYATSSKRSYQMVDGLKAMNESMEDFSKSFHETFPGRFNEMNSSLTCFAKGCVTQ